MKKISTLVLMATLSAFSIGSYAASVSTSQEPQKYCPHCKMHNNAQNSQTNSQPTPQAEAAENPLTGNFDLTTNYMFRGISQSNNLPAVQGGLTYTFLTTGIYLNLWGSNVNFSDPQGNTATVEFDTIAGIANDIGDHFNYNISMARYNYPKSNASYNEFLANAQWFFLTAQFGYSPNVYNLHAPGTYTNIGISYDIPPQCIGHLNNVNLKAGIGHYNLPNSVGLRSYNDYNIQLSKTFGNYVLSAQWTDTNFRSADAGPLKDSHFLGTVLVNF